MVLGFVQLHNALFGGSSLTHVVIGVNLHVESQVVCQSLRCEPAVLEVDPLVVPARIPLSTKSIVLYIRGHLVYGGSAGSLCKAAAG